MGLADWFFLNAFALTFALVIDTRLGEPDWLWRRVPHPVVLIGRFIAWLDRKLNDENALDQRRKQAGILALAILLISALGLALVALALAWSLGVFAAFLVSILVGAILLAQRSLHDHVAAVAAPLDAGSLPAARTALSMIVGRKTDDLSEDGIARAALESLAENHSDGVIAPAFWFLIGGASGIILYKAINTADSMIGYKNERYQHFGWASAKLDDLVNFIPARLTVLLVTLGSVVGSLWPSGAKTKLVSWRGVCADAPTHASPNAGWPEAAYASALGVALGGPRDYPGRRVNAPYINKAGRKDLTATDIHAGLWLFGASHMATRAIVFFIVISMFWIV